VSVAWIRLTPGRLVAAGTLILFVLRAALALPRTGPLIVADEVGYLENARVLAGGVPGQLSLAPLYHGGYSLLLAPLVAIGAGPTATYRLVLVLNAALAASVVPIVWALLVRVFAVPRRTATWCALAAGVYPSVTIASQVALSENLLVPLVAFWLLAAGALVQAETRSARLCWAFATAGAAVWLWAAHGRMIVVPALTAAGIVALAARRRSYLEPAAGALVMLAVGAVGVHLLDSTLIDRNYGGSTADEAARRLSNLQGVGGVAAFARNLAGQSWYLVVATLGALVAAALTVDVRGVLRRLPAPDAAAAVAVVAALTTFGLLAESAVSFRDVERGDMLVYGRYTEVMIPPLVALALARLTTEARAPRIRPALALLLASTVLAAILRTTVHPLRSANRWNVASLPGPTFQLGPSVLLAAGAAAIVSFLVLAGAWRRAPPLLAPVLLVLFLPTTAVVEHNPVLSSQRDTYPSGWTSPEHALSGVPRVAFDTDGGGGLYTYQWFARDSRFLLFRGNGGPPPSRWVITTPDWVAAHRRLGPQVLWTDTLRGRELVRLGKTA
jgi:hypothetical protein